tara:strand:- start:20754 stop:20972 length:219 start_codon:yes stop_codon:yes gene_type:complete
MGRSTKKIIIESVTEALYEEWLVYCKQNKIDINNDPVCKMFCKKTFRDLFISKKLSNSTPSSKKDNIDIDWV